MKTPTEALVLQQRHRNQYELVQPSAGAVRAVVMRFPESEPDASFQGWVNLLATAGPAAAVLAKIAEWFEIAADHADVRAKASKRFPAFADACTADAKNYRAMAAEARAALRAK